MREAEEFIASVPWRAVKWSRRAIPARRRTRNEYVIKDWRESGRRPVRRVRPADQGRGLPGPYRPDYEMRNHYLEIDGWRY